MKKLIEIKREMVDIPDILVKQEPDVEIKQEPFDDDDAPSSLFKDDSPFSLISLKREPLNHTAISPPKPETELSMKTLHKTSQKKPRAEKHVTRRRLILPGPLTQCPGCPYYSYTDEIDAWRHWCEYHIGHIPPYPICKFPKCGWSPDGEEKREHMTSHAKIHFPRAEHFKCEVCGKGYLRNSDRKKHQRGMHGVAC